MAPPSRFRSPYWEWAKHGSPNALEESDVFTKEDGDIGRIPDLQLKIKLVDDNPVQKGYNSIPKPLYTEVKEYVQNLLNWGWVRKSVSANSQSDHSRRLCVDFHELKRKAIPDIPCHSYRPKWDLSPPVHHLSWYSLTICIWSQLWEDISWPS